MSIPRRLGRLARGFVSKNIGEDRFRESIRQGRERGETLKGAFGAAWRGAAEEWRAAEERRAAEEEAEGRANSGERYSDRDSDHAAGRWSGAWRSGKRDGAGIYVPRKYPPEVLLAYHRLGISPGDPLESVNRKRRELVKRHHPDRFVDPDKRARAERLTAEINAAHDTIERHLLRR